MTGALGSTSLYELRRTRRMKILNLRRNGLPYVALCEVWRQLLDAFSNHTIGFTISLQGMETLFSEAKILTSLTT